MRHDGHLQAITEFFFFFCLLLFLISKAQTLCSSISTCFLSFSTSLLSRPENTFLQKHCSWQWSSRDRQGQVRTRSQSNHWPIQSCLAWALCAPSGWQAWEKLHRQNAPIFRLICRPQIHRMKPVTAGLRFPMLQSDSRTRSRENHIPPCDWRKRHNAAVNL